MKSYLNVVVSVFLLFVLFSCDNNEENKAKQIESSKWKVVKIVDKKSNKEAVLPPNAQSLEMIFRTNRRIKILNGCNFSYGEYMVNGKSIKFSNLGPSTEMYCGGISDFEDILIKSLLDTNIYYIKSNQLIIKSSRYKTYLEYIGEYQMSKGKVLFCTNANILNCLFEMEIKVNDKKIGAIKGGSQYVDVDCNCSESPARIGEIYEMPEGTYRYSVKNIKCNATNITNQWSGTFTVENDNCVTVFLDVRPE